MSLLKPIVLGLGLVAGVAIGAQAQTVSGATVPGPSIASLPPSQPFEGPRPSSLGMIPSEAHQQAVVPSGEYPGPRPGSGWYGKEAQTQAVQPSPQYIGPKPN